MDTRVQNTLLRVEFIEGPENINKIIEDWNDLFRRADNMSPVFSCAWVHTIIFRNENKGTPTLITVWDDSKLVALFPLTIRNYFGIKAAIGTLPNELCCTGILADPQYKQAIRLIAETFINEKYAHVFYNKFTSSLDEFTNEFIESLNYNGFFCGRWKRYSNMKLHLEGDFDQVLRKNRNREQRKKLLYHERRILKSGDVKVQRFQGNQISPDVIDRIADIQKNSWIKDEGKDVLTKPFYKKLLLELGKSEIGQVWILTNGVEDIAFIYGMRTNNILYLKWLSYRKQYGSSTFSYGKIIYMQAIRDACKEGVTKIDLGIGDHKWKKFWATDIDDIEIVISGRGLTGSLTLMLFNALKKAVRYKRSLSKLFQTCKQRFKLKKAQLPEDGI